LRERLLALRGSRLCLADWALAFGTGMRRVQAACQELRKADVILSDVATQLGFYDQSSFTLYFRRLMGMTPRRYHQINRTH
jgi:AraC-like DNA-binding protein